MDNNVQRKIEVLQNMYKENADSYRYFVDWRHKVMLRCIFSFATSILLVKVILDHKDLVPMFIWLSPTLIMSISSLIALGMDRRNEVMMVQARLNGCKMEMELLTLAGFENSRAEHGGFYTNHTNHTENKKKLTYTEILALLYKFASVLFFLIYCAGTWYLYYRYKIT